MQLEVKRADEQEQFSFDANRNYKREGSRASFVTPGIAAVEDERRSDSEELYVVDNGNGATTTNNDNNADEEDDDEDNEDMYVVHEQPTAGTTTGVDPDHMDGCTKFI
uniref:Uncharacterized protein n=1 Tax=Elphidium margaritaceum TaxID=933848 RepID=A0A7S0TCM3_9EUKA